MRNPMQPLPSPEPALQAGAGADVLCDESAPPPRLGFASGLDRGGGRTRAAHGFVVDPVRVSPPGMADVRNSS